VHAVNDGTGFCSLCLLCSNPSSSRTPITPITRITTTHTKKVPLVLATIEFVWRLCSPRLLLFVDHGTGGFLFHILHVVFLAYCHSEATHGALNVYRRVFVPVRLALEATLGPKPAAKKE
jgi:hypothetical protein